MRKKKIVILDGEVLNPGDLSWDKIADLGDLQVYDVTAPEQIIDRIGDAEIVFTNKTQISQETIAQTNIRYIGLFSTGYNTVDIEAAKKQGIIVSNVPSYSTSVVAQFTFALLLELCHKVQLHSNAVHEGEWSRSKYFCFWNEPQIELQDKIMGIIGFGNIGQNVARIALAMNMRVLVHTRSPDPTIEDVNFHFVELAELLKKSDVISIHCPLFEETKHLINKKALSTMKANALVINTSRGAIVDEHAMRAALDSAQIAGYATDVTSIEPIPIDSPLINAPNCIITPHIAWVALDTRKRLLNIVIDNVLAFLDNRPQNVVF